MIDVMQVGAIAGAILTILGLAKFVVAPFQNSIKKNNLAMESLQETIRTLVFELKDSQRDRVDIHKILDKHEDRIGKVEDNTIINSERITTLFNRGK